jgi:tetratricopeptide (TPR) repeat protein
MRTRTTAALAAAAALLVACSGGPEDTAEKVPLTPPEQSTALKGPEHIQLDSGNVAYRAKQYEQALRYYKSAAQLKPDFSAAWFGVYMAEDKLGNKEGAAEAMERAKTLGAAAALHHPTAPDSGK